MHSNITAPKIAPLIQTTETTTSHLSGRAALVHPVLRHRLVQLVQVIPARNSFVDFFNSCEEFLSPTKNPINTYRTKSWIPCRSPSGDSPAENFP